MNEEEIAKTYLEQFRNKSKDLFWAYKKVDALCHYAEGAQLVIKILEHCETNEEIAYVAAGPVEDLLRRVGKPVITVFEQAAKENEKVRVGLSGAWINEGEPIFIEWKRLMIKFGYWGNTPISPMDR